MAEHNLDMKSSGSLKYTLIYMKYAGLWMPKNLPKWQKFAYKLYAPIVTFILQYIFVSTLIIDVTISFGDLEKISKISFLLLTVLAEIVKIYPFQIKRKEIEFVLDVLNSETFKPKTAKHLEIIKSKNFIIIVLYTIYLILCTCTVSLWAIFPILDSKSTKELPMEGWYPYDTKKSPFFELTYFYQNLSCYYLSSLDCSIDIFIAGLMINAIAQLDILLDKLEYGYLGIEAKHCEVLTDQENEAYMDFLKDCVIHYEVIFKFVASVEKLFTIAILAQFSTSGLIICVTMFQMTLIKPMSFEFVSLLTFQSCMLLQLFLYCWFGDEIRYKSGQIAEAAYKSGWPDRGVKYCRSLQLIMVRSTRPIQITAGYFFALSVQTFTTILRSAWSYFALLQTVHSTDN